MPNIPVAKLKPPTKSRSMLSNNVVQIMNAPTPNMKHQSKPFSALYLHGEASMLFCLCRHLGFGKSEYKAAVCLGCPSRLCVVYGLICWSIMIFLRVQYARVRSPALNLTYSSFRPCLSCWPRHRWVASVYEIPATRAQNHPYSGKVSERTDQQGR